MQYRAIEIWSANWIVTVGKKTYTIEKQSTKRIPLMFHENDRIFISRVARYHKGKMTSIRIEYLQQIGQVNGNNMDEFY